MLSSFSNMEYFTSISALKSAIQVIILTVFFYKIYIKLRTSSALVVIKICSFLFIIYFAVKGFHLEVLENLLELLFIPILVLIFIIYQKDLRNAFLDNINSKKKLYQNNSFLSSQSIDAIINSSFALTEAKRGALIVIKRKSDLKHIINSGTRLDAEISSQLITTIFLNDTPLHDGAVVIEENKIKAAGCFLPLSDKTNITKSLGTRHRAALGLSEETDALVLVVSEETKKVSLCLNGEIKYALPSDVCERVIRQYLVFADEELPNFSFDKDI